MKLGTMDFATPLPRQQDCSVGAAPLREGGSSGSNHGKREPGEGEHGVKTEENGEMEKFSGHIRFWLKCSKGIIAVGLYAVIMNY